MTTRQLAIIRKAHDILNKETEEPQPGNDLRYTHPLNEAFDGLSGVLYFIETYPGHVKPSLFQAVLKGIKKGVSHFFTNIICSPFQRDL